MKRSNTVNRTYPAPPSKAELEAKVRAAKRMISQTEGQNEAASEATEGEITEQAGRLHQAISMLRDRQTALFIKMAPALRNPPELPEDPERPYQTPLGSEIGRAASRIEALASQVERAYTALEL